jgi:hypothetical protein
MQAKRACSWPGSGPSEKAELFTLAVSYYSRLVPAIPPKVCRKCQDYAQNQASRPSSYKIADHDTKAELGQFTAGIETVNMTMTGSWVAADRWTSL